MTGDLYAGVTGQDRPIAILRAAATRPVHAYLLVGPPGTGKRAAAAAFAASLLCPTGGDHGAGPICDSCRRVLAGLHPDAIDVEREGAFISIETAREVTREAYLSPVENARKVLILHDFHLVRETGPALLKTIEEPPPSTVFVILAEYLPPDLVTIASRCVRVDFDALGPAQVVAALVAEGVDRERAAQLAEAAAGRLDRARLLAADPEFERRRQAWHDVPGRLDGTGATAAAVADELVGWLSSSVAPLQERHAAELERLVELNQRAAEVVGGRAGRRSTKAVQSAGVKQMEERQRREARRQRTDELRTGLATLAAAYRERMVAAADARTRAAAVEAIGHIDATVRSLEFNPGELLALQSLLVRLSRLS